MAPSPIEELKELLKRTSEIERSLSHMEGASMPKTAESGIFEGCYGSTPEPEEGYLDPEMGIYPRSSALAQPRVW